MLQFTKIDLDDDNTFEKIKNIYNDRSILSNLEMIENLNELLEKGNITLSDYNKFIEMEGLNFSYEKEGEL